MSIEEMLKFLGVRTQSKESIDLCYKMDLEAFNMMNDDKIKNNIVYYDSIYKLLLNELNYNKIDEKEAIELRKIISKIPTDETDKEYRDLYFTGLERVLLRYNRYDLIGFQRIPLSDHDGIAKDAYLYELNGDYAKAMKYYNTIGESDRFDECLLKMSK